LKGRRSFSLDAITGKENPDLLIWPEAMISEGVFQDRPLNEAVRDIARTMAAISCSVRRILTLAADTSSTTAPIYSLRTASN